MKPKENKDLQALTNATGRNPGRAAKDNHNLPDLSSVWDRLPAAVRAGIAAMIHAAEGETPNV